MSYSKYPIALDDDVSLPPTIDLVTPVRAEVVNRLRDAIVAIEAELGSDPSRAYGNVRDRLDSLRSDLTVTELDIASINTELGSNPSGSYDTVKARLDGLAAQIDGITALIGVSNQVVVPIVSGAQDTNSSIFVSKGACVLNPTDLGYPSTQFDLEVILQTSDTNFDGYFELFNSTEGVSVNHNEIRTVSTVPEFFTTTITVGGADLPTAQTNILEGRVRLASGALSTDRVICKYAAIRSSLI